MLRRSIGAAGLVLAASGCYTQVPLAGPPAPGLSGVFTVTDAGRVSLGAAIGEGARSFEADIESVTDSAYVVRMNTVTYLNGQTHKWMQERLTVGVRDVTNVRERRFSRSRTIGVAAASVGGLVAFIVTRSLLGSGGGERENPGGGGPPTNQ